MAETFVNGHVCRDCALMTANDDLSHLSYDQENHHRALVGLFDWDSFETVSIGSEMGLFDQKCDLCGQSGETIFYGATFYRRKAVKA